MADWQPIATATMGCDVLLYRPKARERIVVGRPQDWCGPDCCPSAEPTHWMPLPDAEPEIQQHPYPDVDKSIKAERDALNNDRIALWNEIDRVRRLWLAALRRLEDATSALSGLVRYSECSTTGVDIWDAAHAVLALASAQGGDAVDPSGDSEGTPSTRDA